MKPTVEAVSVPQAVEEIAAVMPVEKTSGGPGL